MKIELTPAVIACLKRGLNWWPQQNDAHGIEIKEILKNDETEKLRIAGVDLVEHFGEIE